ncbi:Cytochrome P450 704C1 [Rhynchospora pubera]|uniref:Cytochrome P450 704C1 n=1 Tax=Rhynchospora pubera TaxID=906938 RepID=A0AAV8CY29_9POAL|nr:Cytochrome P450 704C1 [Rhynchospora pubera]
MDSLTSKFNQIPVSLVVTTLLISLCVFKFLFHSKKKRNLPPIAGTIFHQVLNFPRFIEFQTDLSRKYKTFRMLTPSRNYIYTVDPANVEYILKTNAANFGKGPHNYELLSDLLGDGIFAVDGDKWRQQRKIASFEFSTKVLRDYSSGVFRKTATKLANMVSELSSSNQMMDIQDLFMRSTMDSIFKVGFGVDLGTLSGLEESKAFAKAFDDASAQSLYRVFDVFWKIKRFFNIGSEAKMKKDVKLLNDFINNVIDKKTEKISTQKGDFMNKEDILSRFLLEKEKSPNTITNKYLRDVILNFVIAGRDTTAGTLSWFFYLLCKHPNIQEKIAREIREATKMEVENVKFDEFISSCLTEENMNNMQYLHASLSETLRLYPAVPQDAKYCFSDDTLPDGFDIKKGDTIDYQPFPMGRMKFLWGDDAEEFKPERWLDKNGLFVPQSPFKFTAFQAGPRICLGKEFAYRQMKIFAATLLFFFKFQMWDETREVKWRTMLTLQIDGGLPLRAMQRK